MSSNVNPNPSTARGISPGQAGTSQSRQPSATLPSHRPYQRLSDSNPQEREESVSLTHSPGEGLLDTPTRSVLETSENIFDQFRHGAIPLETAVERFRQSLGQSSTNHASEFRERAVEFFEQQLRYELDRERRSAVEGERISSSANLAPENVGAANVQPTHEELRKHVSNLLHPINPQPGHQYLDSLEDVSRDSGSDGFDARSRTGLSDRNEDQRKRRKLQYADLPWASREKFISDIDPSCRKTHEILISFVDEMQNPSLTYEHLQEHLWDSPLQNGPISSRLSQSRSITCSPHCTASTLLKRALDAWEISRSSFQNLIQSNTFQLQQTGVQPGLTRPTHIHSCSLTEKTNYALTENGLTEPSRHVTHLPPVESSSSTKQLETSSEVANVSSSPIDVDTTTLWTPSSPMMGPSLTPLVNLQQFDQGGPTPFQFVINSIEGADATEGIAVGSHTAAKPAAEMVMGGTSVRKEIDQRRGFLPKFKRYNEWGQPSSIPTAEWSITAPPLPSCPPSVLSDPIVLDTITRFHPLFQIITPIKIDVLAAYLVDHPNQLFCNSVLSMLREGAWPFAEIPPDYPPINDASVSLPMEDDKLEFLKAQRDIELSKNRYSLGFKELQPGMYAMPIHAVPKDNGESLRLVTDHSKGKHSLNSMIDKSRMGSFPLDGMKAFGNELIRAHNDFPGEPLVAWKSDVPEAYRLIPMHKHWQIKQVEKIDGLFYVNRCNVFGGHASQAVFIAFMALITWIAKYKKGVNAICAYSDDHFGVCLASDMSYYIPYDAWMPTPQVSLLYLWDEIGIPHKQKKQSFGNPLVIIRIKVDVNELILSLSEDSIRDLLTELDRWISKDGYIAKQGIELRQWQRLAGWLNWSFNVFPLLRPCLSNVYNKMKGKDQIRSKMRPNNAVREDLLWASKHVASSSGVLLLRNLHWEPKEADLVLFTDACLKGMGFYAPAQHFGMVAELLSTPPGLIFLQEAICVLAAYKWACDKAIEPLRIVIYCDNTNVVDMFSSRAASPAMNDILIRVSDLTFEGHHDLKVLFCPGSDNLVADALSRSNFTFARQCDPTLKIDFFSPPRLTLGEFATRRLLVLGMKLDSSTWTSYKSAFASWQNFTDLHNFSIQPSTVTLSNYIMFMSDQIKPSSVATYLSGIVQILEPIFPDIRDIRNSSLVRDTLAGCKRMFGSPILRKSPLTVPMVRKVLNSPNSSYDHLLFKTLLVVGFHSLLRLGDLCDPADARHINPAKRASRLSVKFVDDYATFTLPHHKADKFFEGNTIVIKNIFPNIDVNSLFLAYLKKRDRRHPFCSPLWLTEAGKVPDRDFFMEHLQNFAFGSQVSGQSMRAGGATALASIGVPSNIIQAAGRWSSEAWKIYIRRHPILLYHFNTFPSEKPHHRKNSTH
ncbi:hypothetical protein CVT24_005472 [Panaeolus cyanescens]|uniref:Reverse transcriptase domain-containing protein n=1 Tax=Panaeolus cyanescens TaxID=181874 RepID=A0A409WVU1_9AGAR|nr:hypothetical protein CVT24_005472 [Panaeolus cyanescens]